jgi:undecaprenyl-diphosphatase
MLATAIVAQLVRALDCGSEGRGFETRRSPHLLTIGDSPMELMDAIILGIVQGLTEFFPVSSSAHLILVEYFLGFKDLKGLILFDLVCHMGTLGAIFIVLWKPLKDAIADRIERKQLLLATLPLFPLVFILKPIQKLFDAPALLGYTLLATAIALWISGRFSQLKSPEQLKRTAFKDALSIGIAQACAILPGLSRSGFTISCARLQGWAPLKAAQFSFLLSIPTVLGGMTLETLKLLKSTENSPDISVAVYLAGAVSSFLLGIFALRLLLRIVGTAKFQLFTWYCAALGSLILIYFS